MAKWAKIVEVKLEEEGLTAKVEVKMVSENNYGADADGNRGCYAEFVDDAIIEEVIDASGKDITSEISVKQKEQILDLI